MNASASPSHALTRREARRVALAAQGFGAGTSWSPRPGPAPGPRATARRLLAVAQRLGFVQIDSVNVVSRSHYLPFFSRLGGYDRGVLDMLRDGTGPPGHALVEYWGHEASLLVPEVWPLLGFRMRRADTEAWGGMRRTAAQHPDLVTAVHKTILEHGPMTARSVERVLQHDAPRLRESWGWNWSVVKQALEHLFWTGRITSAGRTAQFERRYADVAQILPAEVLARGPYGSAPFSDVESFRGLVELASRALGVGTSRCLRDYARLGPQDAAGAVATLVEEGTLVPVRVEGWRRPGYLHRAYDESIPPPRRGLAALLSPFDSLIWQRDRTLALFDFDYRLEIYTPATKRVYGYYVLPFLYGDRLVARVDAKTDRLSRTLLIRSVHWEEGLPARVRRGAPEALREQLTLLAHHVGCEHWAGSTSNSTMSTTVPSG